jgi:hypothetical protein
VARARWNGDLAARDGKTCALRCDILGCKCSPCKFVLDFAIWNDARLFNGVMERYDKFSLTSEELEKLSALRLGDQGSESLALSPQDLRAMAVYRRALLGDFDHDGHGDHDDHGCDGHEH